MFDYQDSVREFELLLAAEQAAEEAYIESLRQAEYEEMMNSLTEEDMEVYRQMASEMSEEGDELPF